MNIIEAYAKTMKMVADGESPESAVRMVVDNFDIDYDHDAAAMMLHWHCHRAGGFCGVGGYPLNAKRPNNSLMKWAGASPWRRRAN